MNSLSVCAWLKRKAELLVSAMKLALIISCAFVFVVSFAVLVPADARANELKLFHVPDSNTDNPTAESDSSSDLTEGSSTAAGNLSSRQKDSTKKELQRKRNIEKPLSENNLEEKTYRYDGFVSSDSGRTYLINGQPLGLHSKLELLEDLNGGSTLKLQTESGRVFLIGIGGTIKVVML